MLNLMSLLQNNNPQQTAMNMLMGFNNPVANNAVEMMKRGDYKGVENIARNLCATNNIDPEALMKQIKGMGFK